MRRFALACVVVASLSSWACTQQPPFNTLDDNDVELDRPNQLGRIVTSDGFDDARGGVWMLDFSTGDGLNERVTIGDVSFTVVSGSVDLTVGGQTETLNAEEAMLFNGALPHAVVANSDSRVVITRIAQGQTNTFD